ncbi:MAG: DUF3426 domain-containing protein [Pseudomonadales bacterium]|jgi:predicted Zn finger-like uncharacterized protein|nr:DUF3426 domain-containing protein [Pseudomonadales bacterium]
MRASLDFRLLQAAHLMASLLAQCPHCQTSFRVSRSQLALAGGQVRCGSCLGVFSAHDNEIRVKSAPPLLDQPLSQAELSSVIATAEDRTAATVIDAIKEEYTDEEYADDEFADEKFADEQFVNEEYADEKYPDKKLADKTYTDDEYLEEEYTSAGRLEPNFSSYVIVDDDDDDDEEDAEDEPAASGHFDDDFDDELADAPLHATPPQAPRHFLRALLYGLGSVILLGVLALQVIAANFDDLSQNAYFAPLRPTLCRVLICRPVAAPPTLIAELLVVRAHPSVRDALEVSATLRNKGAATQPLPGVELIFRDGQDRIMASRLFMPEDYLPPEERATTQLLSQNTVPVHLELANPGADALHYELALHPLPAAAAR